MQQVMHFHKKNQSVAETHDKFNSKNAGYVLLTANALWIKKITHYSAIPRLT
jgi:serine protease inhibitor